MQLLVNQVRHNWLMYFETTDIELLHLLALPYSTKLGRIWTEDFAFVFSFFLLMECLLFVFVYVRSASQKNPNWRCNKSGC